MGQVIAILGAESTGKTTLAHTLAARLASQGLRTQVVAEYLREFCDTHARTPRIDEQVGIAQEQTRRIALAARSCDLVFADTTALMTAVYSDYVFCDASLYREACAQHAVCAFTLVTGLDLPWQADGLQRDGEHVREPVDVLLRRALQEGSQAFGVVYGQGDARTEHAMAALRACLGARFADATPAPAVAGETAAKLRWSRRCAECLVPECEHLGLLPRAPMTP
jgi:nicotinamide riboside kinase